MSFHFKLFQDIYPKFINHMEISIIKDKIYELRGHKVILDFDLSILYGVESKQLKRAVRRNIKRFPSDFMFELDNDEWESLRSQIGTSSWGGLRYLPFAFTEHGITMLASILNSEKAIAINIAIVRAFISLRQVSMHYKELSELIREVEKATNIKFNDIYKALDYLFEVEKSNQVIKKRRRIGFKK